MKIVRSQWTFLEVTLFLKIIMGLLLLLFDATLLMMQIETVKITCHLAKAFFKLFIITASFLVCCSFSLGFDHTL